MKSPLTESERLVLAVRERVKRAEGVAVALLFAIAVVVLAIGARPV